ncbi:hypothetical protein ACFQ07_23800, partial [Actinomadura adrarensis]
MSPAAAAPLPEPAWGGLIGAYFVLIGVPSGVTLMCWWLRRRAVIAGAGHPTGAGTVGTAVVERYGHWTALA